MRSLFLVVLLLVLTITAYPQKRTLSLEESIKIALQRNTTLQKSVVAIPGFESNVQSAYGNLLPSIGANGSWNWSYRPNVETQRFVVNGIPINLGAAPKDSRNYSAGAGENWVLFDGLSNYASIAQSKNDLEAARLNLRQLKANTVYQTISLYYLVLSSEQILGVRKEDLKYNQKNLDVITEKNKLGAVTLADVYNQQVQVGNSKLALVQAENDWETNKANLLNFLGVDVVQDVVLTDTSTIRGKLDTTNILDGYNDLTQLIEAALNNRADYQGAKYSLESAKNSVTIARGGYFPQLSNSANVSMNGATLNTKELYDSRTYNVGLTLSIPLFSGWSTSNNVQQAKVRERTSEIDLIELERQIKVNLKTNYLNIMAAKTQVEVSENNVLAAEQNRRIQQEKYNLGSSTLVDLLLASSNYTAALQSNIAARFSYLTLKSQLEFNIGLLDFRKYE